MMMKIVGLNYDCVFYQIKVRGVWKQYRKSTGEFIHMMYVLFPAVMKKVDRYNFVDMYQLANWLYNYGEEVKPCDTYIFHTKFDGRL